MAKPKARQIEVPRGQNNKSRGKITTFPPGSEELEALAESGYMMDAETAKTIIEQYEADKKSWPFEEYKKAKAFMATVNADPVKLNKDAYATAFK